MGRQQGRKMAGRKPSIRRYWGASTPCLSVHQGYRADKTRTEPGRARTLVRRPAARARRERRIRSRASRSVTWKGPGAGAACSHPAAPPCAAVPILLIGAMANISHHLLRHSLILAVLLQPTYRFPLQTGQQPKQRPRNGGRRWRWDIGKPWGLAQDLPLLP